MTVAVGISCAAEVSADEALLRQGEVAARVAVLNDRAISVGVGVPDRARFLVRGRGLGWPVVRRETGGTGLLHSPGDLAWTMVLPRSDPRVGRDYVRAYERLGRGVVRFLESEGISASWEPSPGLGDDYCLFGPRGSVLSTGRRVLGGAAQHLSARALLHHGIVPRTIDRGALVRVFGISEADARDRLTSLTELGLTSAPRTLARKLGRCLSEEIARP